MAYQAWFQCQKGCDERYSLYEVVYRCKKCGSLLEVVHDMEALRDRSAQQWKDLFDARYMRTNYPYGSAIWGKLEWVCPTIDPGNVISMYEGGHEPLLGRAPRPPARPERSLGQAVRQ